MPISVSVSVGGSDALKHALAALGSEVTAGLEVAVTAGALVIQNEAKRLCPVKTGNLSRSIHTETISRSELAVTATVGTDVEYGKWVEFGTGIYAVNGDGRQTAWSYQRPDGTWARTAGNRPQPFMRPAFDTKKAAAAREIQEAFSALVRKAAAS